MDVIDYLYLQAAKDEAAFSAPATNLNPKTHRLGFGKYRGKLVRVVPRHYLKWAAESATFAPTRDIEAIKAFLAIPAVATPRKSSTPPVSLEGLGIAPGILQCLRKSGVLTVNSVLELDREGAFREVTRLTKSEAKSVRRAIAGRASHIAAPPKTKPRSQVNRGSKQKPNALTGNHRLGFSSTHQDEYWTDRPTKVWRPRHP